eukprot:8220866-Lingulodinium_polyedra.AAC.1
MATPSTTGATRSWAATSISWTTIPTRRCATSPTCKPTNIYMINRTDNSDYIHSAASARYAQNVSKTVGH